MTDTVSVIRPGTEVVIRVPGIVKAMVTTVSLTFNDYVQYRICYWKDGIRYDVWMEAAELSTDVPSDLKMGFI